MQRRSQRSVTEIRRTLTPLNAVSRADRTAAEDFAEDAPDGHDAIAGQVIDGAFRVAFFPDLADPQADRGPDNELVADRQARQVEPACRQVLGKGARAERDGRRARPEPLFLRF